MKIAGITAEYNPLHNGHLYHIAETRRQTGCDAIVVAMSGDFVQRGEPAMIDKWLRTEHALKAGADLIVEIPTLFCLGNASQYASAGVCILESLGCSLISFGSGSGDIKTISEVAGVLAENREMIRSYISEKTKEGKSYPAARMEAYKDIRSGIASKESLEKELAVLSEPNDILAIEYVSNMERSKPLAIKRQGAYHEDDESEQSGYRSAEYIRQIIETESNACGAINKDVPEYVSDSLGIVRPVFPDDCFEILKFAILSTDAETIDKCPSGGEGLGNLIKTTIKEAGNYEELVLKVKSKRYTYTRISRLCMQIMLGISREKYSFDGPEYIRILGHNEKGRELLAAIRTASKDDGSGCLPMITNINKESEKLNSTALDHLLLDIHASEVYHLISRDDSPEHAEQRMRPVII